MTTKEQREVLVKEKNYNLPLKECYKCKDFDDCFSGNEGYPSFLDPTCQE